MVPYNSVNNITFFLLLEVNREHRVLLKVYNYDYVVENLKERLYTVYRDRLIMLNSLPIMLSCSAHKNYLLHSKLCSRKRIVLSLFSMLYTNKLLL